MPESAHPWWRALPGTCVCIHADHAFLCHLGPIRYAIHREYADVVAEFLEEAGAVVRREAFVKEIRRATSGRNPGNGSGVAILDVWAFGCESLRDILVDVTHRHPMKAECQPRAAQEDGLCCRLATRDKEAGYPASAGRSVTTACVESWGRCGVELELLLTRASATAARLDKRRGRAPAGRLASWRARLDAVSQRAAAMALASAREGLPGEAAGRGRARAHALTWPSVIAATERAQRA